MEIQNWNRTAVLIITGLALKFGSPLVWALELPRPVEIWAFLVPYCLGNVIYLWGCCVWCVAKNRNVAWGFSGFLCVCAIPIIHSLQPRAPVQNYSSSPLS